MGCSGFLLHSRARCRRKHASFSRNGREQGEESITSTIAVSSRCEISRVSLIQQCFVQARRFLQTQNWERAKREIYSIYNRDTRAQQRRCIVSNQVTLLANP